LLKHNFEKWGETEVAFRDKDQGIWNEYTWKDVYENVKYFSLGLISLGFQPGSDRFSDGRHGSADQEILLPGSKSGLYRPLHCQERGERDFFQNDQRYSYCNY
jgi:hypothetical protein